jgi:hypothetical protein
MCLPKSQGSGGLHLNYALDAASQYVEQEVRSWNLLYLIR